MKKNERKILHKSLDGELNKKETRILKRSLDTNPEVKQTYEQLKAFEKGSKEAVKPIQVPSDFTQKVIGKIRDTEIRPRAR